MDRLQLLGFDAMLAGVVAASLGDRGFAALFVLVGLATHALSATFSDAKDRPKPSSAN